MDNVPCDLSLRGVEGFSLIGMTLSPYIVTQILAADLEQGRRKWSGKFRKCWTNNFPNHLVKVVNCNTRVVYYLCVNLC